MSEIERVLTAKEKKKKKKSSSSILIKKIKNYFRLKFPRLHKIKLELKKDQTFSGWGMNTYGTCSPWSNQNKIDNQIFSKSHNELVHAIKENKFKLTQFYYEDVNYKKILEELRWRHYTVFNTILYVINFLQEEELTIVECGVCDGLTVHFAMKAAEYKRKKYTSYLYDTWAELESSEEDLRFKYSYLDIETTKYNLQNFSKNTIYNKGHIPDVFDNSKNPEKINWLHIDLNSNNATSKTLEFFYNKISHNGVILFDDYGGFDETRKIIDNFFENKNGHFVSLPTGQGIFYKNNKD
jgi:O-methyltransferase